MPPSCPHRSDQIPGGTTEGGRRRSSSTLRDDQRRYGLWVTQFYRLFGPGFPAEGQPFDSQVVKSAFELDEGATLPAGRRTRLTGRSWSASGPIRSVEVSTDGGRRWHRARPVGPRVAWQRWAYDWRPETPGPAELLARATDMRGDTQPDVARFNALGYVFDAVVRLPVTVV